MADGSRSEFSIEEHEQQHLSILSKKELIIEMIRDLRDYLRSRTSPSENESEFPTVDLHLHGTIDDVQQVEEQQVEESMMQIEAHLHTPVEVNETAESNPIIVEEISIQDVTPIAENEFEEQLVFEDMPNRVPADEFQVAVWKDSAYNEFDEMVEPILKGSRSSSSMHEQLQPTSPADSCSNGITENPLVKAMEDDQLFILEGGASITKKLSDQIDAENETRQLFDESTELVDEYLDADSLLQFQEETIFEQEARDSENEALKMFDKSTKPIFTALREMPIAVKTENANHSITNFLLPSSNLFLGSILSAAAVFSRTSRRH